MDSPRRHWQGRGKGIVFKHHKYSSRFSTGKIPFHLIYPPISILSFKNENFQIPQTSIPPPVAPFISLPSVVVFPFRWSPSRLLEWRHLVSSPWYFPIIACPSTISPSSPISRMSPPTSHVITPFSCPLKVLTSASPNSHFSSMAPTTHSTRAGGSSTLILMAHASSPSNLAQTNSAPSPRPITSPLGPAAPPPEIPWPAASWPTAPWPTTPWPATSATRVPPPIRLPSPSSPTRKLGLGSRFGEFTRTVEIG